MTTPHPLAETVQVLAFDIFGTVVDWHGSIVRKVQALYPQVDANAFALAWRDGYQPAMQRVRSQELGWTRIDDLHRLILDGLPSGGRCWFRVRAIGKDPAPSSSACSWTA